MDPPFSFRSLARRWSFGWKGPPGEVRDGGLDSGVLKSKPFVILEFSLGRSSSLSGNILLAVRAELTASLVSPCITGRTLEGWGQRDRVLGS